MDKIFIYAAMVLLMLGALSVALALRLETASRRKTQEYNPQIHPVCRAFPAGRGDCDPRSFRASGGGRSGNDTRVCCGISIWAETQRLEE